MKLSSLLKVGATVSLLTACSPKGSVDHQINFPPTPKQITDCLNQKVSAKALEKTFPGVASAANDEYPNQVKISFADGYTLPDEEDSFVFISLESYSQKCEGSRVTFAFKGSSEFLAEFDYSSQVITLYYPSGLSDTVPLKQ